MANNNEKVYIYALQIIFVSGISFGSRAIYFDNMNQWLVAIARFVSYLLIVKGTHEATVLAFNVINKRTKLKWHKIFLLCSQYAVNMYVVIFVVSISTLLYLKTKVLEEDFITFFIAYLVTKYPDVDKKKMTINYGEGMACSFVEGYLVHVIPSDGMGFAGFAGNIDKFEAKQRTIFPVKKLFIIYTKSLSCPPDLKEFNKDNRDLPYLEAMQSLEEVEKDVAGVKNRSYKNAAYKIYRSNKTPVAVSAECASPLLTLRKVLDKKAVYEELADVDPQDLADDFCSMLRKVIIKSGFQNRCELLYFDDTDPTQNLADILLNRIRELAPDFEDIINRDI